MSLPTHSEKHLKENINIYKNYDSYIFAIHKIIKEKSNDENLKSISDQLIDSMKNLYLNQLELFEFYRLRKNKEIEQLKNLIQIIEKLP